MLRAVVVGINRYRDPDIRNLSYARADAEAFGKLLADGIHPSERSVRFLLDEEATKRNLMVAIGEDLARVATPDDVILLYFAGHGSPETESGPDSIARYLIAHDTEYSSIYATGIDMERDLQRWFERIAQPKWVLMFMDACFSGRAGGRTFEGPNLRRARADARETRPISLKQLDLGEGRLMMSACDDDQVAREERDLKHGVFTYYLLQMLKLPNQEHATISVNRLYDDVTRVVREHTGGRQVPILNGRSRAAQIPRLG